MCVCVQNEQKIITVTKIQLLLIDGKAINNWMTSVRWPVSHWCVRPLSRCAFGTISLRTSSEQLTESKISSCKPGLGGVYSFQSAPQFLAELIKLHAVPVKWFEQAIHLCSMANLPPVLFKLSNSMFGFNRKSHGTGYKALLGNHTHMQSHTPPTQTLIIHNV